MRLGIAELGEKLVELGEAFRSESLLPVVFDLADRVSHGLTRQYAARCEGDALGARVLWVCVAFEVAGSFEVAEQVVECLLADAQPGGELGGSGALGSGVEEDVEVGCVEVVESVLVEPFEHPPSYGFPRRAQERADQRWPERLRVDLRKGA